MENNKWLSPKKAAEIAGVNEDTIRRWDAEGKIKCIRTEGGHRRCDRDSLMKYLYKTDKVIPEKVTLIYARVSTRNRLNDLERQKERLERKSNSALRSGTRLLNYQQNAESSLLPT